MPGTTSSLADPTSGAGPAGRGALLAAARPFRGDQLPGHACAIESVPLGAAATRLAAKKKDELRGRLDVDLVVRIGVPALRTGHGIGVPTEHDDQSTTVEGGAFAGLGRGRRGYAPQMELLLRA